MWLCRAAKVMHQSGAETLVTEEPYALIAHVRVCGGAGWATAGSTRKATASSVRSCLAAAPRRVWQLTLAVRGRGAGRPPGALRAYFPRHQRFSSASQWLHHVPFALLRRSIATWWRAHQPSWLAGGVGSGAWLGAAGWSLLAAA